MQPVAAIEDGRAPKYDVRLKLTRLVSLYMLILDVTVWTWEKLTDERFGQSLRTIAVIEIKLGKRADINAAQLFETSPDDPIVCNNGHDIDVNNAELAV